ncbi:MAG: low molecular weight protein-tyrosine-phosphatase [Bacteroidales bacterium]|nr:low molecular weight protein-tyrosine-phosphatase [Bacteroidales bacterium]
MEKILFVCHGNICRSPMAEMIFKKMVADAGREHEYEIASAATSTEEIGNDIYPPAKECLRRHGIPFTRRGARQMTRGDYAYYDRIFVMDQNNLRYLHWQMPEIVQQLSGRQYGDPQGKIQLLMELVGNPRDVADPWYTGNFEATYNDVVAGCKALLAE